MKIFDHITNESSLFFTQEVSAKNVKQVYGGDINSTFVIETTAGIFFIKLNKDSYADMFQKEFEGLNLLSAANAIKVPKPILCGNFESQIFLVMEAIEKGIAGKYFWKYFAYSLADLHKQTASYFGLDIDNYIGSLTQSNRKHETWASFYAEERILPLVRKANAQNKLSTNEVGIAEKLCEKFPDIMPAENSSLLHGDLWSGNFTADKNGDPVMYDPAVYYGHREMDIAMTKLFGGFHNCFYDYYNEASPLQSQWQERLDVFQLYPLLVHLILFGRSYYNSVMSIFKKYS